MQVKETRWGMLVGKKMGGCIGQGSVIKTAALMLA